MRKLLLTVGLLLMTGCSNQNGRYVPQTPSAREWLLDTRTGETFEFVQMRDTSAVHRCQWVSLDAAGTLGA